MADTGQQTVTIQQALDLAVQHHSAGRLPEAEGIYQQILKAYPNQPVALRLLGTLAHQVGKHDLSVDLISKALTVDPGDAEAHNNLGITLFELGRLDEAVASHRQAVAIRTDYAEAHSNLGNALQGLGKLDDAIASYQKALAIKPDFAEAHCNLGNALHGLGKPDEALASYHKAVAIQPNYVDAHTNLGITLLELGKLDEAIASFRKALVIKPNFAEAHNNLGIALYKLGKLDEAIASFHKAIAIRPDYAEAHNNLGVTLRDQGELERAIGSYQKSYMAEPGFTIARHNHGSTLMNLGRYQEAIEILKDSGHQLSRSSLLECLYAIGEQRKFYQELENIIAIDKTNLAVAAISSFAAYQFDCIDPYPFCSNPMDFISTGSIFASTGKNGDFLKSVQDQITEMKLEELNQSLLHSGIQSIVTLFSDSHGPIAELENALRNEVESYFSKYAESDCLFVKLRPEKYVLRGWYIAMEKGGHLDWHNHPTAWLSGAVYFNVPPKSGDEANIEFALHCDKFPNHRPDHQRQQYPIAEGNFIFFPSSLYHRTVPFYTGDTRFCVAFDVVPDKTGANSI